MKLSFIKLNNRPDKNSVTEIAPMIVNSFGHSIIKPSFFERISHLFSCLFTRTLSSTKNIFAFSTTKPGYTFSGWNNPVFRFAYKTLFVGSCKLVKFHMFRIRNYLKVTNSIITWIMIFMMDMLLSFKRTSYEFFHNKSMLKFRLSIYLKNNIAFRGFVHSCNHIINRTLSQIALTAV